MTLFSYLSAGVSFVVSTPSLAIALAALLAWKVSNRTIRENRKNFKDRETIAMMQNILWDDKHIKMRDDFIKARDGATLIDKHASNSKTTEYKAIVKMLNHHEQVAISINREILSEAVFKDFLQSPLVADWQKTAPFIDALREKSGKPRLYREFQTLAEKWQEEP